MPTLNQATSGSGSPVPYTFSNNLEAAQYWLQFGFNVIPVFPGAKNTCVQWNPWLAGLTATKIRNYWHNHPRYELGFIVGEYVIVLDADSPDSIASLALLEEAFDVVPNLVIKTTKGEHHYFRRTKGTHAKTDSHSTKEHPDRIDVKATRSLVILPPSTGKFIDINEAEHASGLSEVGQAFIDAVFRHNGRPAPRPFEASSSPRASMKPTGQSLIGLRALLDHLDPDLGYTEWVRVLMAIYHETGGSDEGFDLAHVWSSEGLTYKGEKDIRTHWRSFRLDVARPVTIGTICMMVAANGLDCMSIISAAEDPFEVVVDAVEGGE